MRFNYLKFILIAVVLSIVIITVPQFASRVYAGATTGAADQTAYAVFQNNGGSVGTQIGLDSSPVNVEPGQYVFVCLQLNWTTVMKQRDMKGQWRTWGGTWQDMAAIGAGSSTAWEYWNSNYADHTVDAITAHFGDTNQKTYTFESDYPGYGGSYPTTNAVGKNESWFIIQAPENVGRYEIRWYDSESPYAPTTTVQIDITVVDYTSWGGIFYNKPGDTTEQTEAGTYANGLYAYLDEDNDGDPLTPGTAYTFYVNVHEWQGNAIASGGTLNITIPKQFTSVSLVDKADFYDAAVSGGGASDWTITGTNDSAISNAVDHLSFSATTPTEYFTNTNWEFDTRFTGTGGGGETVRYIVEAVVLVQAATWESYNDEAHTTVDDYFSTGEQTVYMFGEGFQASTAYHVAYYDGDNAKVLSDGVSSNSGGDLSSLCYFPTYQESAVIGTWHAVVYKDSVASPPETYIASDPNSVVEDSFEVTYEAIPEFPTVIAGIAVAGMCFGIYYWMRKRRLVYVKA